MAVGSFVVPPVERIQLPLVARRSGVQDQNHSGRSPYEQSKFEHRDREEKKAKPMRTGLSACLMSATHIDCRI